MNAAWLAQLPLPAVATATPVSGGDVNQAWHLRTQAGEDYFLLVQPGQPQSFYDGEVAGLRAFARSGVTAPRVIAQGTVEGDGFLVLSYLTSGTGSQADLGRLVAHLHAYASPNGQCGFEQPTAGTSISFANRWTHRGATCLWASALTGWPPSSRGRGCGPQRMPSSTSGCAAWWCTLCNTTRKRRSCYTGIYGAATLCSPRTGNPR